MKTGGLVAKFIAKLADKDEHVVYAAVQALSTLGTNGSS